MSHAILPEKFLDWAYFGRVRFLKSLLEGGNTSGMKFLIESTRHTPALATARIENGKLFLNAKVVGSGFVLKREFMEQAIIELKIHVESGRSIPSAEYNKMGIQLLLKLLYFENKEEALNHIKTYIRKELAKKEIRKVTENLKLLQIKGPKEEIEKYLWILKSSITGKLLKETKN
ncbi:MAG: hypothetical protein ACP5KW_11150 [Thermoproteota archaeon]